MDKNFYISIDFGTCNTVISYFDKTTSKILQIFDNNECLIPTIIYFTDINEEITINNLQYDINYVIGESANTMYDSYKNNKYYFYQFKRFLGLTIKSNSEQIDFLNNYNIKYELDDELIYFYIPIQESDKFIKLSIINLVTLFFKGLYLKIKTFLNINDEENIDIVLTCPAFFHDLQRKQLKKAVENANFKIIKIYNEPTSAAIYYINNHQIIEDKLKFIVYDLGGGTIDTTVVEYHKDMNLCEILDIDGNNSLGGVDIDNIIVSDLYCKYNINKNNLKWKHKIRKYAEEIKIKLTYSNNINLYLENVPINKNDEIVFIDSLKISYSRHYFNSLIEHLIDKMIEPIINYSIKYNINNIIFIGGPTQIPLLQNKVYSLININFNNLELIENKNSVLYKIIVSLGGSLMYRFLNDSKFSLLDIIPMNIGISNHNDEMITILVKNSKIPTSFEKIFSTTYDCQRTIEINVYEGLDILCINNTFIGSYKIIGIPPFPRGLILIKLLFQISYNGILNISINGFKNPSDESCKSFDFKLCENIKLISNAVAKDLLKKILFNKK